MTHIDNKASLIQPQLNNHTIFYAQNGHKSVSAISSTPVEANDVINYMDTSSIGFKAILLKNGNGTVEDSLGKRVYKNGKLVKSTNVKNGNQIEKNYRYQNQEGVLIQECQTYVNGKYDSCVSTAQTIDKEDPIHNKKITICADSDDNITKVIATASEGFRGNIPVYKTTILEMKDGKIEAKEYCRDGNGKPYQVSSSDLDEIKEALVEGEAEGISQQEMLNQYAMNIAEEFGFEESDWN